MTATRTVSLAYDASRSAVTSSLGISNATTQSVTVTCTSSALPANTKYTAWPRGVRYRYQIHKWFTDTEGFKGDVGTSGWLYAFDPAQTRITCS